MGEEVKGGKHRQDDTRGRSKNEEDLNKERGESLKTKRVI